MQRTAKITSSPVVLAFHSMHVSACIFDCIFICVWASTFCRWKSTGYLFSFLSCKHTYVSMSFFPRNSNENRKKKNENTTHYCRMPIFKLLAAGLFLFLLFHFLLQPSLSFCFFGCVFTLLLLTYTSLFFFFFFHDIWWTDDSLTTFNIYYEYNVKLRIHDTIAEVRIMWKIIKRKISTTWEDKRKIKKNKTRI